MFNGGGWSFSSDAFGNVVDPALCTPAYRSLAQTSNSPEHQGPGPECGPGYNLFFEPPAADLPGFASSADGNEFVNPDYVTPSFDDTTYTRTNALSHAGALSYDLSNFTGNYVVRVDVDGNGSYTDPLDVALPQSGTDGTVSAPWNGGTPPARSSTSAPTVNFEGGDREDRRDPLRARRRGDSARRASASRRSSGRAPETTPSIGTTPRFHCRVWALNPRRALRSSISPVSAAPASSTGGHPPARTSGATSRPSTTGPTATSTSAHRRLRPGTA